VVGWVGGSGGGGGGGRPLRVSMEASLPSIVRE
jgi:hypothetical protein